MSQNNNDIFDRMLAGGLIRLHNLFLLNHKSQTNKQMRLRMGLCLSEKRLCLHPLICYNI